MSFRLQIFLTYKLCYKRVVSIERPYAKHTNHASSATTLALDFHQNKHWPLIMLSQQHQTDAIVFKSTQHYTMMMRASQSVGPFHVFHIRATQQIIFPNVWQFLSYVSPRSNCEHCQRLTAQLFLLFRYFHDSDYMHPKYIEFLSYEYILVYIQQKNLI